VDLDAEAKRVRSSARCARTGRNAVTLVAQPDLHVLLASLRAGARIDDRAAAGPSSVHVLSGRVHLHADGRTFDLGPRGFVTMEPGVPHDIEAVEDAELLLTITGADRHD